MFTKLFDYCRDTFVAWQVARQRAKMEAWCKDNDVTVLTEEECWAKVWASEYAQSDAWIGDDDDLPF